MLPRDLLEVEVSQPPDGPFDLTSPYLSMRSIPYYGNWWAEFFIPRCRLPDFRKGQAERDGIDEWSIAKSRPIGKRKRDDETDADASPDAQQSEEEAAGPATKATKEVRMQIVLQSSRIHLMPHIVCTIQRQPAHHAI